MVNSLVERKWNFNSAKQALSVLTISDRFCMNHVNKHILSYLKTINSDFFSTLIYGDFSEKKSGNYVIKEVDARDFTWLVNAFVERKWNFTSTEQALSVFTISDRFCMNNVNKHILSYLKTANHNLPLNTLKRFASLAARCRDNGEFMTWIFEICQSATGLITIAQSCGSSLPPHMSLFFHFLATKQEDEKSKNEEKIKKLKRESETKDLRYFVEKHKLADEKRILSEQ
ncbi:hypothetical protein PMAYCL1PPCAC_08815, partial [Pristionchus mayeri]